MLQVARLSPKLLGDAADLTAQFFSSRINPDGGFQNRQGESDLYYTVFGLEGLRALQRDLPVKRTRRYLESFGEGRDLDFVHTACLARCWANLDLASQAPSAAIAERLERARTADGGYDSASGDHGTAYGCFLALGAYQDMGVAMPQPERMLACLDSLRSGDGGYANQPAVAVGLTPPTAAAMTIRRAVAGLPDEAAVAWLLARCQPDGGFFASPLAPLPDLLSTATALHAVAGAGAALDAIREPCLDFVDTLWSNQGGFYGHWSDDVQDCEYTYYGLLALGHLGL